MAAEQNYEDDPIIAELGISQDARPVIPPVDIVHGHFQVVGSDFRLYHKYFGMYMQTKQSRIKRKEVLKGRSKLHLRADGNYEGEVIIGYTSLAGVGEGTIEASAPQALYAAYAYPKTTPWHE
ncbi:MAG TPA: hypothetical protein VFQ21_09500 [Gemmatimonadota bacterium]|nr:hypothetical protein [Gemmatimonadota bacterium]